MELLGHVTLLALESEKIIFHLCFRYITPEELMIIAFVHYINTYN